MKRMQLVSTLVAGLLLALPLPSVAQKDKKQPTIEEHRAQAKKDAPGTIADYKKADPGMERFFSQSAGYVVFPRVGKVGFIVGGGNGVGAVYEKDQIAGSAMMTFGTVGLQIGAQEFSEIIFFQDAAALDRFKQNKFEFTANASAVILKAGASSGANYRNGVVVFTQSKGGAMLEAALGGQKLSFSADK